MTKLTKEPDRVRFEQLLIEQFAKRFANVGFSFTNFKDLIQYEKSKPQKYKNSLWSEIAVKLDSDAGYISKYYNTTWSKYYLELFPQDLKTKVLKFAINQIVSLYSEGCDTKKLQQQVLSNTHNAFELKSPKYYCYHYETLYHELYYKVVSQIKQLEAGPKAKDISSVEKINIEVNVLDQQPGVLYFPSQNQENTNLTSLITSSANVFQSQKAQAISIDNSKSVLQNNSGQLVNNIYQQQIPYQPFAKIQPIGHSIIGSNQQNQLSVLDTQEALSQASKQALLMQLQINKIQQRQNNVVALVKEQQILKQLKALQNSQPNSQTSIHEQFQNQLLEVNQKQNPENQPPNLYGPQLDSMKIESQFNYNPINNQKKSQKRHVPNVPPIYKDDPKRRDQRSQNISEIQEATFQQFQESANSMNNPFLGRSGELPNFHQQSAFSDYNFMSDTANPHDYDL